MLKSLFRKLRRAVDGPSGAPPNSIPSRHDRQTPEPNSEPSSYFSGQDIRTLELPQNTTEVFNDLVNSRNNDEVRRKILHCPGLYEQGTREQIRSLLDEYDSTLVGSGFGQRADADSTYVTGHFFLCLLDRCSEAGVDAALEDFRAVKKGIDAAPIQVFLDLVNTQKAGLFREKVGHIAEMDPALDLEIVRRYIQYVGDPRVRPLYQAYFDVLQDTLRDGPDDAVDRFLNRGSPSAMLDAFNRFVCAGSLDAQRETFESFTVLSAPRTHTILRAQILQFASDDRDKQAAGLAALKTIVRYSQNDPDEVLSDLKIANERSLLRRKVCELIELNDHMKICAYLKENVEIACEEALQIIDEVIELQDSESGHRYVTQVRDLVARAKLEGIDDVLREMRGGNPKQQALLDMLEVFLFISDVDDRRRYLQEHPIMYTADALELFGRVKVPPESEAALEHRIVLLHQCREVGVHAAHSVIRNPSLVARIGEVHRTQDLAHKHPDKNTLGRSVEAWSSLARSYYLSAESADAQCYVLNGYAHACARLIELTADHSVEVNAVDAWRRCAELTGDESGEYRGNAGVLLERAFRLTGSQDTLFQALEIVSEAADAGSFNLTVLLIRLADYSLQHFGDSKYVERALRIGFAFVEDETTSPSEVGRALIQLAELLETRDANGDTENAVECLRRAEPLLAPNSDDWVTCRLAFGKCLHRNFGRTGDSMVLAQCIDLLEPLVRVPGDKSGAVAGTLARAYRSRYEITRDVTDLSRSVQAAEDAIGMIAARDKWNHLPLRLHTLALSLQARYRATGDVNDLNHAVDQLRRAVGLSNGQTVRRATYEYTLCSVLRNRFQASTERDDIDEAINISRRLQTSAQGPLRRNIVSAGARALFDRFEAFGDKQDLEEAIASLNAHLKEDDDHAEAHRALSEILRVRCRAESDPLLEASVVSHLYRSCELHNGASEIDAWRSMARLGVWAASRRLWDDAANSLLRASQGFLSQYGHSAFLPNSNELLGELNGLSSLTAFALTKCGREKEAAEVMLSSNARRLAGASISRWSLVDYSKSLGAEPVAREMAQLAREWDGYVRLSESTDSIPDSASIIRMNTVRSRLEELSKEISDLTGIKVNASRSSPTELVRHLNGDGLFAIAISEHGGCAVMVSPQGQVSAQLYESLTSAVLERVLNRNFNAYGHFRATGKDIALWSQELRGLLRWCRDEIIAPLLDTLSEWAGITIVAVGGANLLPIHAALVPGLPGREHDLGIPASYLAHGDLLNDRSLSDSAIQSFAIFHDPRSSKPRLMGANAEALSACRRFPGAEAYTGEFATRAALVLALPRCSGLHLSCHAEAMPPEPLRSCIHLAQDERLDLSDIMDLDLRNLELVVLSGCETAMPGFKLLDEVISLPTAFLSRGASCVLASGWAVPDFSTAILFSRFYYNASEMGRDVRQSLTEAQHWLRSANKLQIVDFIRTTQSSDNDLPVEWETVVSAVLASQNEIPYEDPISWAAMSVFGQPRLSLTR